MNKKQLLDGQLSPIRESIKMMTDASIIFAGGTPNDPTEDDENTNDIINANVVKPTNIVKKPTKFQNKFAFLIKAAREKEKNDLLGPENDAFKSHEYNEMNHVTTYVPCNTPTLSDVSLNSTDNVDVEKQK